MVPTARPGSECRWHGLTPSRTATLRSKRWNGDTLTETFTVKAADGTPATVTITINGSKRCRCHLPSSGTTGSVTEDTGVNGAGNLVANGTLTVTDTDAGQAGFQAGTTHGAYGDLALNADGTWTYTAANNNPAIRPGQWRHADWRPSRSRPLMARQPRSRSPSTGRMTRPSSPRLAPPASVAKDTGVNGAGNLVANGTLSVTDTDAGQAGFQASTNGELYGDPWLLNADGWHLTYTAANGNPAIQTFKANGDH